MYIDIHVYYSTRTVIVQIAKQSLLKNDLPVSQSIAIPVDIFSYRTTNKLTDRLLIKKVVLLQLKFGIVGINIYLSGR